MQPDRAADERLLRASLDFAAQLTDPALEFFRESLAGWGSEWSGREPQEMIGSTLAQQAVALAAPGSEEQAILAAYVAESDTRYWEQSYTAADPVGEDMLSGYGFAEIIGARGPFISNRLRTGVGIYAHGVNYPPHHHLAEEVYVILAGSATYTLGDGPPVRRSAGDVVHVTPNLVHGFTMDDELLAVFYLWQNGDLREKSTFV